MNRAPTKRNKNATFVAQPNFDFSNPAAAATAGDLILPDFRSCRILVSDLNGGQNPVNRLFD
jgi:hypothetical protein